MIYVIAHSSKAKAEIGARFGENNIKNNNIEIIAPDQEDAAGGTKTDKFEYNFTTINQQIFGRVLEKVDYEDVPEETPSADPEADE